MSLSVASLGVSLRIILTSAFLVMWEAASSAVFWVVVSVAILVALSYAALLAVSWVAFSPMPVQKPHPTIWVGGRSRRGVRRAVRYGNAWYPSQLSLTGRRAG